MPTTEYRSTLSRGDEIEEDFYRLKSQEFGPRATKEEIKRAVEAALQALWELSL